MTTERATEIVAELTKIGVDLDPMLERLGALLTENERGVGMREIAIARNELETSLLWLEHARRTLILLAQPPNPVQ